MDFLTMFMNKQNFQCINEDKFRLFVTLAYPNTPFRCLDSRLLFKRYIHNSFLNYSYQPVFVWRLFVSKFQSFDFFQKEEKKNMQTNNKKTLNLTSVVRYSFFLDLSTSKNVSKLTKIRNSESFVALGYLDIIIIIIDIIIIIIRSGRLPW